MLFFISLHFVSRVTVWSEMSMNCLIRKYWKTRCELLYHEQKKVGSDSPKQAHRQSMSGNEARTGSETLGDFSHVYDASRGGMRYNTGPGGPYSINTTAWPYYYDSLTMWLTCKFKSRGRGQGHLLGTKCSFLQYNRSTPSAPECMPK
jgi:hypothetical protein